MREIYMNNVVNLKVVCLNNDNRKDEIHFEYYNNDNDFVGLVIVDETGKLFWTIDDLNYEKNILDTVSSIFGAKVENNIGFIKMAREAVPIRWDNAQNLIESRGLVVNYRQNEEFSKEFKNGTK